MHNIYLGYETNLCGEGCNFEVITFDYVSIFFKKHNLKMSAKFAQQSMIFNIPDLLCPKPLITTGVA